jgi:hypothetical protein
MIQQRITWLVLRDVCRLALGGLSPKMSVL